MPQQSNSFLIAGEVVVCGEDGVATSRACTPRPTTPARSSTPSTFSRSMAPTLGAPSSMSGAPSCASSWPDQTASDSRRAWTATARSCSGTPASSGWHHVQAPGCALPFRPQQDLAQGQEPGEPGDAAVARRRVMVSLVLRRASVSRQGGDWNDEDFDVFDGTGERAVGRIHRVNAATEIWFWGRVVPAHQPRELRLGAGAR
jgi:hypothetical protein